MSPLFFLLPIGAFLLGSIPFGLLIARSKGVNIREVGSGNIGATNVFRAVGKKEGLLCFILDILKGAIIPKEQVSTLQFSKTEVLQNKKKKVLRAHYLNRAAQLGNLLKNKVNIYFKDADDKLMRVHTTIWAVTTDSVILKQGVTIPRNCVVFVD